MQTKWARWVLVFVLIVVFVAQDHPATVRAELDEMPTGGVASVLSVLSDQQFNISPDHGKMC